MKPSFHIRALNGPFDDPGLYVRVIREGRAVMFDLGQTAGLSSRDILKTTDIFVSHTHVDHFIGFDNVLRICLKKEQPLRIYGPRGFIDCIDSRLRSYTWNIVQDYPLIIEVFEIHNDKMKRAIFKARNSFHREAIDDKPFRGIIMKDSFYFVSTAILDHNIPCLAFSIEEDIHININKAKLQSLSLPVGPWLRSLKKAIRERDHERRFTIQGKTFTFEELSDIATVTKGQKLAYVVDAVGSSENIEKIINLARGADVLYIETYFSDEDRDMAFERYHLTAKQAGIIAQKAGVGRLEAIHFSPRYMDDPDRLILEAQREFNQ